MLHHSFTLLLQSFNLVFCFHTCITNIIILAPSDTEEVAQNEGQMLDEETTSQETQENPQTGEMHHKLII